MHLYQPKSFTPDQESVLRKTASDAVYVTDFLTEEEFDICRNMVLSTVDYPEVGKTSKYYGFSFADSPGKQLQWLFDKIQRSLLPNMKLDFFAIQEAINPWKIHADIRWKELDIPYKVILIPVDVEPISGPVSIIDWPETYTLTFDQRNFLSKWDIDRVKHGPKSGNTDQSAWLRPIDNIQFENFVDGYQIDNTTWNRYLSHMDYTSSEGLSINAINHWKPRSLMYWDNTMLHCSDNFLASGIRTKRSLMIFSNYLV